ncbi:MAG: penicillin-binding protein 2 [Nitrospinae bacterium]|nr:penicillin-binding protein 2 [Nitrospinota bacterium]MZH05077.1 penicillin-binding protein 2 [Nitrospinota bacterium]MZH14950.1 penicillin-binding protein 2 [Nitrospinota bacterium]
MSNNKNQGSFRNIVKTRLIFVSVLLFLFAVSLIARLADLQIVQHEALLAKSEKQPHHGSLKTYLGRGSIFDRNGNELATNLKVESVFVVPQEVRDRKYTSKVLAFALKQNYNRVYREVSSNKKFAWIKRKASADEIAHLKKLALSGVGFRSEQKRFYPKRELAANVIGFVGTDDLGLAGIEHTYQEKLKGIVYSQPIEQDGKGRKIQNLGNLTRSNLGNYDLMLTLDEVIQFTAEYHLKNQVERYRADSGMAVVMDPNSGEIYAMANVPQFNPNNFNEFTPETRKNNTVVSSYEPGSIFKPIVAAAALDKGIAQPHDKFFCENGNFKIGGKQIGEASDHRFGYLTMREIISKSSNIGAIKIAQKLGKESFYEYIRKFGFGQKTGVRLPGASSGLLGKKQDWNEFSLASISFGHEIAVTPLQMVVALSAIANGGTLMEPHITKALMRDGKVVKEIKPKKIRRVVSEKTSRQMMEILKFVVKDGTGKKAAVDGFDIAGKTGTAQKYNTETRSYSKTEFISSFIGYAPADAPRLVILVMIDNPKKLHWGGVVAAPVFREIAKKSLRYLNVPSSKERVFILDRA